MEQEDFLKSVLWLNQLKLRLGYGVTGNAAVSRYVTKGSINSALYPYGDDLVRFYFVNDQMATSTRIEMANNSLGWEKTGQYNVGLDFSVLKSRISGSLEYYISNTSDLLLNSSIPALTGYETITANIGKTKNHGMELTLNTLNVKLRDLSWETSVSLAWQDNEIVELQNGKEDDVNNTRFIGYPIGVYYNYKALGIWKEEDAAFQRPQTTTDGSDADLYAATLQYSKASFVNIRTISLGYSFPKNLIKKWNNMQTLRIYAQCVNPGALYQSVNFKNMDLNSSIWNRNFVIGQM
jgi:hypothetical protein